MSELTDEQILQGWITFIQNYCNNKFQNDNGQTELPSDIEYVLLPYLIKTAKKDPNVASESVADLSRSFFSSDIPDKMRKILDNYRRVKW